MADNRSPYRVGYRLSSDKELLDYEFCQYSEAFEFILQRHEKTPQITYFILDSTGTTYYPEQTRGEVRESKCPMCHTNISRCMC